VKEIILNVNCSDFNNNNNNNDQNLQIIQENSNSYLKEMIDHLVKLENLNTEWSNLILKTANIVVKTIIPNHTDNPDIRDYIRFQNIDFEKRETEVINGGNFNLNTKVLFRNNVVHKKMKTNIKNAKILLLSCGLEYSRSENELSNLDILINQEKNVLRYNILIKISLMVAKICEENPNIIFCEKSVSPYIKDMLLHEGVSLVVNVKKEILGNLNFYLDKISSCTGIKVYNSINEISINKNNNDNRANVYLKKYDKYYFIVEATKKEKECTILLKSNNNENLKAVKDILKVKILY
jgi:chaperonin GroEL (HSP60 family)